MPRARTHIIEPDAPLPPAAMTFGVFIRLSDETTERIDQLAGEWTRASGVQHDRSDVVRMLLGRKLQALGDDVSLASSYCARADWLDIPESSHGIFVRLPTEMLARLDQFVASCVAPSALSRSDVGRAFLRSALESSAATPSLATPPSVAALLEAPSEHDARLWRNGAKPRRKAPEHGELSVSDIPGSIPSLDVPLDAPMRSRAARPAKRTAKRGTKR